jgi:hypothetical protein
MHWTGSVRRGRQIPSLNRIERSGPCPHVWIWKRRAQQQRESMLRQISQNGFQVNQSSLRFVSVDVVGDALFIHKNIVQEIVSNHVRATTTQKEHTHDIHVPRMPECTLRRRGVFFRMNRVKRYHRSCVWSGSECKRHEGGRRARRTFKLPGLTTAPCAT